MKKRILILILVVVFAAAGCVNDATETPQSAPEPGYDISNQLDDYMASIMKQSALIKYSLEQEALTQADMNVKSQELLSLWDDALNYIWSELKIRLPEAEFAKLQDDQRSWIAEKEAALEEAGKEFQGGSVYALIVNSEAAKMTEERVCLLYTLLK